jgi:hypothetical protein
VVVATAELEAEVLGAVVLRVVVVLRVAVALEAVVVLWAVAALEVLVILVVALADHSHTEDL